MIIGLSRARIRRSTPSTPPVASAMLMIMKHATRLGQACTLLTLAVLAGVAEMIIALLTFSSAGEAPSDLVLQLGLHMAAYAVAFLLIGLTWRGNRIARWIVLIMLGVIGTGTLVIPLITELAPAPT